jgi:hypothetical protein
MNKQIDKLIEEIDKLSIEIDDYNKRDFDESGLGDFLDVKQIALLAKADSFLKTNKKSKLSLIIDIRD